MTKCLALGCTLNAAEDSPLCPEHREKLRKAEEGILTDATRVIKMEMRQFERLMLIEPPLHPAEISFRMVWPIRKVQRTLRKFKDDRA